MKSSFRKTKLYLATALIGLCVSAPLLAAIPGHSHAFGQPLAYWDEVWTRVGVEEFNQGCTACENLPTVLQNNVVRMPVPVIDETGTGSLDVTLSSGQAFIVPLWWFLGADYTDGTPPDEFLPLSVFQTLDITFKVDGVTVVDQSNVLDFYTASFFNQPIPLVGVPPINSWIWFQGISIVYHPLSVGTHTLHWDAVNTEDIGFFFPFHITLNVTVVPGNK